MLGINNGPNFCGGNLIINDKKGKSISIPTDAITKIENCPRSEIYKPKGIYIYTNDNFSLIQKIPYQTVIEAYEKAKNDNINVEINEE